MSARAVTVLRCDLCGLDGAWLGPGSIVQVGTVDLCRWCAEPPAKSGARLASGEHEVTFAGDDGTGHATGWTCSCGHTYRRPVLLVPRSVLDAVPSLVTAIASNHVMTT